MQEKPITRQELQAEIALAIQNHNHSGNFSQRINWFDIFGTIQTVTQAPSGAPTDVNTQLVIYNNALYWYDFSTNAWLNSATITRYINYASGTVYALTATPALLDFGTTDPTTTITQAGTYLITGRVRLDYTGATFAASRTVTLKFRRTNNTASDLTNSSVGFNTDIITTLTYTAGVIPMPHVVYTTTNTDDVISIFGSVSVVPSAGSIDATEAEIVCIRVA